MPVECVLSVVGSNFQGKGDIMSCSYYRTVKLHEHGMKVVGRVLEFGCMAVNEMQFGFLPVRGTIDTLFIKRFEEMYHYNEKYVFCGPSESF